MYGSQEFTIRYRDDLLIRGKRLKIRCMALKKLSYNIEIAELKTYAKLARVNENSVRNAFIVGLPNDVSRLLQATPNIDVMPMDEVMQITRAMMSSRIEVTECVNVTFQKQKICTYCKKSGHLAEHCFKKLGTRCWTCNGTDHISRACPNKPSGNANGVTLAPVSTPMNQ